jgi:hypothetical protein
MSLDDVDLHYLLLDSVSSARAETRGRVTEEETFL